MADSWNQLYARLRVPTKLIVEKLSKEVSDVLGDKLYNLWYMSKHENTYMRTYELVDSIRVTEVNIGSGRTSYTASVYFDDNLINHMYQSETGWGQHQSTYRKNPINMEAGSLAWILDQGAITPFYRFDGVKYVEATLNDLKYILSDIKKEMKSMGYNITLI